MRAGLLSRMKGTFDPPLHRDAVPRTAERRNDGSRPLQFPPLSREMLYSFLQ